jgi:hypothetical protein
MTEQLTDPTYLIPAARSFEQQMATAIDRGEATSWHGAEELLIAGELAPIIPRSRQRDYIDDRPDLWHKVTFGSGPIALRREAVIQEERENTFRRTVDFVATSALQRTYQAIRPALDAPEHIKPLSLIERINESLDSGLPVSVAGFGRQGKTTLAFSVGESRDGLFVHSDAQLAPLASRHTADAGRFMVFVATSDHERIKSVIGHRQDIESSQTLWTTLNEYARLGGERVLVCFDELGTFANERYADKRAAVAKEMTEITELSNLDLLVIEHIRNSQFTGELQDILPSNIKRFIVPPISGPEMFDFLRAYTKEARISFLTDAVSEIHDLTGGTLALAALVGAGVIRHATSDNSQRLIYNANDVKAWEDFYVAGVKEWGPDEILEVLFQIFGNLNADQQALVEQMAQSSSGIPYRGTPSTDVDFLIQTNVATFDQKAGKLLLTSRLLRRLMPNIKNRQEITATIHG